VIFNVPVDRYRRIKTILIINPNGPPQAVMDVNARFSPEVAQPEFMRLTPDGGITIGNTLTVLAGNSWTWPSLNTISPPSSQEARGTSTYLDIPAGGDILMNFDIVATNPILVTIGYVDLFEDIIKGLFGRDFNFNVASGEISINVPKLTRAEEEGIQLVRSI